MDFFQAQDSARTRTKTLVVLFVAAVAAIIAAIYFLLHVTFGPGPGGAVDPGMLIAVAIGTILLVSAGSTVRTLQLRQGGSRVAEMLGGRRVAPDTMDEHERRLVNVVEEMSIASGTPVPAIYVLDNEAGINAFAAGYTLDDAAVAVTRGTLHNLTRDELQGVIAHEFSHILNGDMRLNVRLLGLLFGILLLAILGRGLLHGSRGGGRRNGAGQVALVGIGLVAIGYIGVFFGRLIQAAVSRQREYLADAAAVQFTRAPEGLAGALKKIGAAASGSRIQSHHAAEASHLFFANGIGRAFTSLLATHPPLGDRIRRIDRASHEAMEMPGAGDGTRAAVPGAMSFAAGQGGASQPSAQELVSSIGVPRAEHVAYAHQLLESLPQEVIAAAHDPDGAQALLFALLLPEGDAAAERSIIELADRKLAEQAEKLASLVRPLGAAVRLPLLDILLPALRTLPASARTDVRLTAERLIRSDGRTDVFEFAVYHVLGRQLVDERNAADSASVGAHSVSRLKTELELVLSAIAWYGADDITVVHAAFGAGARSLPGRADGLRLVDADDVTLERTNAALERLRHAAPAARRQVLEACVRVVTHDRQVAVAEAEMLRAVAEALDCPMPPPGTYLAGSRSARRIDTVR